MESGQRLSGCPTNIEHIEHSHAYYDKQEGRDSIEPMPRLLRLSLDPNFSRFGMTSSGCMENEYCFEISIFRCILSTRCLHGWSGLAALVFCDDQLEGRVGVPVGHSVHTHTHTPKAVFKAAIWKPA
eukprot:6175903-Amphidinium_carterae.1